MAKLKLIFDLETERESAENAMRADELAWGLHDFESWLHWEWDEGDWDGPARELLDEIWRRWISARNSD